MDQNLQFLSTANFLIRYPGISILDYISVVQSIPYEWKRWIKNDTHSNGPLIEPYYQMLSTVKSVVSIAYNAFHTHRFLLNNKANKWFSVVGVELWPDEFLKIVKALWSITNCSKLRTFQYKLLMHAIVTKVNLKQWKIVDNDLCTFCNKSPESILHLFWECKYVKQIWARVSSWFTELDDSLSVSRETIFFNNVHPNPNNAINTVTLITKFYIYKTKCANNVLNIFSLLEDILLFQRLEHMGALVKNKGQKSEEKWLQIRLVLLQTGR